MGYTADRIFTEDGIAPTLAGADGGGGRNPAGLILTAEEKNEAVLCFLDHGGERFDVNNDFVGTLKADIEHRQPMVLKPLVMGSQQGDKVRITSAEVIEQTSSAAHLTGGTSSPVCPLQPPAGFGCGDASAGSSPLGEQEGHVGRTESSPTRHTGAKRPVISAEMTWVYEGHGKDARYTGPLDVAPTVASAYGEGGGNIPLALGVPHAFSLDSAESNSMKSKNKFSGCRETDLARTIDTTNPCPSKGQGGIAIVQESYCIAGNIIDRQDHNGGNGCGFQPDISYTLTATDIHAVCEPTVFGQHQFGNYKEGVTTLRAEGGDSGGGSENLVATADTVEQTNLVRRLTPLECERLMGYPDGWTHIPKCSEQRCAN